MIRLAVDGAELEVWRSAASTMPAERVSSLMPDLWELGGDAFPRFMASVVDEDLVHHYLEPTFGAYQFVDGRLRAITAAETFDLTSGWTLYFSNSSIHSSMRGRGLYQQMLLLRIVIGRVTGCEWWATRTQSPIVAQSLRGFGCYPWLEDDDAIALASQVAEVLYADFAALGRRDGEGLDVATGVLHAAYPSNPYDQIPEVADSQVQTHFDAHVDRELGDALLLVGRLDSMIEALAPQCVDRFGVDFDTLCQELRGL